MYATIKAIEYYLPVKKITNEDLAFLFPGRSPTELACKTGVCERHVAADDQCASDLAVTVGTKLFDSGTYSPSEIDFILLCTQTPDYFLPATACLVQHRLGIPVTAGALDFNLGCSGYVYGLGLAKALIETCQASHVLLITADTVTRIMDPDDRSRVLIGDAATATVVESCKASITKELGPFVYGTDGGGAEHLIVHGGAFRDCIWNDTHVADAATPMPHGPVAFHMNGPKIVEFSLRVVPSLVETLLKRADLSFNEIDLFVFHQASKYILDLLQNALSIPQQKLFRSLSDCGNTVASTIPIALKRAAENDIIVPGCKLLVAGFGVGLSWGATIVRWSGLRGPKSS